MAEDTREHGYNLRKLSDYYTLTGNNEQARSCYEKAAKLQPNESWPYVGLGAIALEQDQLEDAEGAFRKAIWLDRKSAKAYCGLGMVYQGKKDFDKAFENYMQCLELDANNLTAILGLFQTSSDIESFSKVRYYLGIYLDSHPDDIDIMFCLANLCIKDTLLDKAKEVLKKILTLEPYHQDAANLLEEVEHEIDKQNTAGS